MKRYRQTIQLFFLALLLLTGTQMQQVKAQGGGYVSYQTFYDDLAPYGEWISDPQYGYVWVPDVESGFQPYYSRGHWVMTEYGNTWVSDYDWGWAPFHYGRWSYDAYYGWIWIPGSEWGPAWVSWRSGGGYYGWAPLGPNITVNVSFGSSYYVPNDWWIFIPSGRIYSNNYYSYYRGPRYNTNYIHQTTIINNTYINNNHVTYVSGPRSGDVRRYTNNVPVYSINNMPRSGGASVRGNTVNMYRPQINNSVRGGGGRPAPRNAIAAPRNIGRPEAISVNNGRPQGLQAIREQRNNPRNTPPDVRQNQPDRPNGRPDVRQQPDRPQQQPGRNMDRPADRPQQQRPMDRPQPQMDRPQPQQRPMDRPQPQMDRPQPQQRPIDRPQPQMDRPQPQQRPMDRPQPQMDRPQPQQRPMDRPQPQMDRPQPQQRPMDRPQPQMDRPQPQQRPMDRPQPQMDRPQPQQRSMDRPQPQMDRPQQMPDRGGRR